MWIKDGNHLLKCKEIGKIKRLDNTSDKWLLVDNYAKHDYNLVRAYDSEEQIDKVIKEIWQAIKDGKNHYEISEVV